MNRNTRQPQSSLATVSHCIDLNADLGEGFGPWQLTDDQALLGIVSSANLACGGHAGDAAKPPAAGSRLVPMSPMTTSPASDDALCRLPRPNSRTWCWASSPC